MRKTPCAVAALLAALLPGCAHQPPGAGGPAWRATARIAPPSARAGCFAGQLGTEPWAEDMAESTLWAISNGGLAGTAFAVRGSGSFGMSLLLTAKHNVDSAVPRDAAGRRVLPSGPADIVITAHDGTQLGRAEVVAMGRDAPRGTAASAYGTDMAVLRMTSFAPGADSRFRSIPGMPLARAQPSGILTGLISDPGGTEAGISGAMIVDGAGAVRGVMVGADRVSSGANVGDWQSRVIVTAGGHGLFEGKVTFAKRPITVPSATWAVAEPVTDPSVLAALGSAGERVDAAARDDAKASVQSPGYPLSGCVVYRGEMGVIPVVDLRRRANP